MNNTSGGVGLGGVVFVVFLILKLTHTIDWSWWWITAPLWLPTLLALGIGLVIAAFMGVVKVIVGGRK